jgi:hypothetical protein
MAGGVETGRRSRAISLFYCIILSRIEFPFLRIMPQREKGAISCSETAERTPLRGTRLISRRRATNRIPIGKRVSYFLLGSSAGST